MDRRMKGAFYAYIEYCHEANWDTQPLQPKTIYLLILYEYKRVLYLCV